MSNFNPIWTRSLVSFAQAEGIKNYEIIKNPHTGNNFIVFDNGITSAIGKSCKSLNLKTKIHYFGKNEDGEDQYVLTNNPTTNVVSSGTISELS